MEEQKQKVGPLSEGPGPGIAGGTHSNGGLPEHPRQPVEAAKPTMDDQYLFFNVMPKVSVTPENVVAPSVKIASEQPATAASAQAQTSVEGLWQKYHWWVISALAGCILVAGGLFAYSKMTEVKEDDLISTAALMNASRQKDESAATAPTATSAEWKKKYFNSETCVNPPICGDEADPDRDGLSNEREFSLGTDPNNADSDQDGLADGDEVDVFKANPLSAHTGKDAKYNDADYIKGGYSLFTEEKMTVQETTDYTNRMKQFGLHSPTTASLKDALISFYKFSDWTITGAASSTASSTLPTTATTTQATTTVLTGVSNTVEAKQDRDAQRSATIRTVGISLVRYHEDSKVYPKTSNFMDMFNTIKPYLKTATRPDDPINKDPYVYRYELSADGNDYTLSFYSEVAGQVIKKHAADAQKDISDDQGAINDDQRKTDVEMIKTALLLYSNKNANSNQDYIFPTETKYKSELVAGGFIAQVPKDPKTGADYQYQVSDTYSTFTVKAALENPPKGTTGYLCNQDECRNY